MPTYVKKRLPVKAVHFDPETDGIEAAIEKLDEFLPAGYLDVTDPEDWEDPDVRQLAVFDTLHNTWVSFYDGDWIIEGIEGEYYPHNGELFAKVYEEYAEDGASLVADERRHQVEDEGYDPQGDVGRVEELVTAAVSYLAYNSALHEYGILLTLDEIPWPWHYKYFKPSADEVRNLQKAGGLIAAAIDASKSENQDNG